MPLHFLFPQTSPLSKFVDADVSRLFPIFFGLVSFNKDDVIQILGDAVDPVISPAP